MTVSSLQATSWWQIRFWMARSDEHESGFFHLFSTTIVKFGLGKALVASVSAVQQNLQSRYHFGWTSHATDKPDLSSEGSQQIISSPFFLWGPLFGINGRGWWIFEAADFKIWKSHASEIKSQLWSLITNRGDDGGLLSLATQPYRTYLFISRLFLFYVTFSLSYPANFSPRIWTFQYSVIQSSYHLAFPQHFFGPTHKQ